MALRVKLLNETARLPCRGSDQAAGYDLYATEGCAILPGRRAVVPTGISIGLPEGTYGRIAPRSGLAVKHGIQVGAGVVDPDYTGEIKVVLFNHDRNTYVIRPGYRIAQLILEQCVTPDVVEVNDLCETDRGEAGFGSTGTA
jgi:dUTP pyrophosphatase